MPSKLLFVCLGNICRSPSAENIMNLLVRENGLEGEIVCDSAGTGSWHVGSPPNPPMAAAAFKKLGIQLEGAARQFQPSDFEAFDLILAMDHENYANILCLAPQGKYDHKVKLMCDYCRKYPDRDVPDPYYGGAEGFDYVIDLLMDSCGGLLEELKA